MTKHTIKPVLSDPDFVKEEEKLVKEYFENGLVDKYLHKNDGSDKRFSFMDGPITANNPMGVHHGWGRTYKDLFQKYKNLQGFKQRFQNGFDCQGLWVEVEVEKELKFKSKRDIEDFGVAKFVELCKERVRKYSQVQTKQSQRLGYFMDWENSYFTMSDENNYMIWHFLKKCHEEGWLYKGHESVPWCPRCQTAISQHEMLTEDYKEVVHDTIYLKLPVVGKKNEYLLIWTTTPWTLPANIAVAIDEKLDYSLVEGESGDQFWVAQAALERVFGKQYRQVLKTIQGKELIGLKYQGPFDALPAVAKVAHDNPNSFHTVVATDPQIMPITTTEGTGLVHTAVSAGTEDFKLGKLRGLPMVPVIDDEASYLSDLGWLTGQNAKKHPELILNHLTERDGKGENWVFRIEKLKHRYPGCWRCKTELVWKVADEWYLAMDKPGKDGRTFREKMLRIVEAIHWIPDFGRERELDWLKSMHDWLISKPNRYWGLALPIYPCQCGTVTVVGGREELHELAVEGWEEFEGHTPHKPYIDAVKIKCPACGQTLTRIGDVGNVWLDAGIVPYSTLRYQKDRDYWQQWFPVDFITESFPGQFKNWFYSMIAMSAALEEVAPYRTVLGYASMLAEDGRPMHKSWGNAIDFETGAGKIGVDIMRWLYVRQNPVQNLLFGYRVADEVRRRFHLILWNSYRYFIQTAVVAGWQPSLHPSPSLQVLDRWLLSSFTSTLKVVTTSLENFDAFHAALSLETFVSDLSTWYIRRSRGRTDQDFLATLHRVLTDLSIILSPFMPFMPDRMYRNLTGKNSVHLASWPKVEESLIDSKLESEMALLRQVVELGHSARKKLGLRVRQPLASAVVTGCALSQELKPILLDELNLKAISFLPGETLSLQLDTLLTPALKAEGEARDLMRDIQGERKKLGLTPSDLVVVTLPSWPPAWEARIKAKVGAATLKRGDHLIVTPYVSAI